jgi:hypothetical protein
MSDEAKKLTAEEQAFWDAAAIAAMQGMVSSYRTTLRGKDESESDADADITTPERELMIDQNRLTGEYEGANEIANDAGIIADALLTARRERGQQ